MPGFHLEEFQRQARVAPEGLGPGARIGGAPFHQLVEIEPVRRVGRRHRREQRLRIRMDRVAEQHAARRQFDDAAGAHDRDAVRDVIDNRQIVRDEQVGQPQLFLQIHQQIQNLCLDRDIERRDRLVADDQLGA